MQSLLNEDNRNKNNKKPPKDSFLWKFWRDWNSITPANQALHTDFLQDIQYGTLDPVAYGGFNTSDAYYFLHGAEDYVSAASRAMNLHNDECSVELKKGLQSDDFSVYKAVLCSLTQ